MEVLLGAISPTITKNVFSEVFIMAFCDCCQEIILEGKEDINVFHFYKGGTEFKEECCFCSKCVKKMLKSGYVVCDSCGESIPCIGKAENFESVLNIDSLGFNTVVEPVCNYLFEHGGVGMCEKCKQLWASGVFKGRELCPHCHKDFDFHYCHSQEYECEVCGGCSPGEPPCWEDSGSYYIY